MKNGASYQTTTLKGKKIFYLVFIEMQIGP